MSFYDAALRVLNYVLDYIGIGSSPMKKHLKGFKRVNLEPNETKTAEIPLWGSTLAWWDAKLPGFRVEAEPVRVTIGDSSSDIKLSTRVQVE